MRDPRSVLHGRRLRRAAALAVLPALLLAVVPDAARADDPSPTVSTSTPDPSTEPSPPTTPAPPWTTPPTTAPAVSLPTLRPGATGPDVLRLQRRLRVLGYDVGKANSSFDEDTLHGVRAFQKVQHLPVDGVVSAPVWARLADPVVPRTRYVANDDAVEVDLTARVLYLTRGGAVTAIFDVSPGKRSTPTVTGRFTIYRRVNRWDHGPLGGLYRPNYFHHGFALHGSLSVPTYSASHGCVRLTPASMDRLWQKLSVGERVSVYRT
jgi:peptidoglycan hydrolase-like protein with peptidoglycan-binding domain